MKKIADIFELVEAVESASNVSEIKYNKTDEKWTIFYVNKLEPSKIDTENLVEFLYNG